MFDVADARPLILDLAQQAGRLRGLCHSQRRLDGNTGQPKERISPHAQVSAATLPLPACGDFSSAAHRVLDRLASKRAHEDREGFATRKELPSRRRRRQRLPRKLASNHPFETCFLTTPATKCRDGFWMVRNGETCKSGYRCTFSRHYRVQARALSGSPLPSPGFSPLIG